jgi:hypothetical protein
MRTKCPRVPVSNMFYRNEDGACAFYGGMDLKITESLVLRMQISEHTVYAIESIVRE